LYTIEKYSVWPKLFTVKTLIRLFQIGWVLGWHFTWWGLVHARLLHPKVSPAERLSQVLEQLGTAFVKLGQGLSIRQDIFPDDYVKALQSLQDHVQPFPGKTARREIESALGDSIENLFAEFEIEPMAAASIAQVHKARLKDGRRVIVKVRRPDLKKLIDRDIALLKKVLRVIVMLSPKLQQYDLLDIVTESGNNLNKELDFRKEMRNMLLFQEAFKDSETVHIPAPVPEYSTERILVQMLSSGKLVTDPTVKKDGPALAAQFFDAYLHQLFVMGCIHGDPHPGNLFIMDNGKICFHDFGLVGYLDTTTRRQLTGYFLALVNQDSDWLLDAYLELGMLDPDVDPQQARRGLSGLMQEYNTLPLKDWSLASVMLNTVRSGWGKKLRLPYHLLIFMRTLFMVEATLRNLDPEFKMIDYLKETGAPLMASALKGNEAGLNTVRIKYEAAILSQDLPGALAKFLRNTRHNGFEIKLQHQGTKDFKQHLDRSSNRVSVALVALGLFIASSIIAQSTIQPVIGGIPLIAIGGYALAFWITFRLLQGISRSGQL